MIRDGEYILRFTNIVCLVIHCVPLYLVLMSLILVQHTTQTSMPHEEFEPAIPAGKQLQTYTYTARRLGSGVK